MASCPVYNNCFSFSLFIIFFTLSLYFSFARSIFPNSFRHQLVLLHQNRTATHLVLVTPLLFYSTVRKIRFPALASLESLHAGYSYPSAFQKRLVGIQPSEKILRDFFFSWFTVLNPNRSSTGLAELHKAASIAKSYQSRDEKLVHGSWYETVARSKTRFTQRW
jgi:hypothetical protein